MEKKRRQIEVMELYYKYHRQKKTLDHLYWDTFGWMT